MADATKVTAYTKTLVVDYLDGTKQTFTGTAAMSFQKTLEDNRNFKKVIDGRNGVQTFFNINPNACGICKTATVTPGTTQVDPAECEDALSCPAATTNPGEGGA